MYTIKATSPGLNRNIRCSRITIDHHTFYLNAHTHTHTHTHVSDSQSLYCTDRQCHMQQCKRIKIVFCSIFIVWSKCIGMKEKLLSLIINDILCWHFYLTHTELSDKHLYIGGGILPRLRGFPWNRNWNPWLMTKKTPEKQQSKSVFCLSQFCCVLKLFPDLLARYIVVLAFKNGHANRHRHSRIDR